MAASGRLTQHQKTAVVLIACAAMIAGFRLSGHGKPMPVRAIQEPEPDSMEYAPPYPMPPFGLFPTTDYESEKRKLDAESRIQEDRDRMHDREMARIDGMSLDQYRSSEKAGIVRTIGADSVGKIGSTLYGDIIRTSSAGTQWVLEKGKWYPR